MADEIISLALKDKPYYDESGGGITLSGGEPMAQLDFTLDVLKKAKAAGLHTALETCGFTRASRYLDVMPYVDLFLYDYKATDPAAHKEYTGADNHLILDNLKLIAESGAEIILRCPLIPGFNDTDDHLKGIANLSLTYPNIKMIEIMPYHTIGLDKAKKIGSPRQLAELPASTAEDKLLWLAKIRNYGCPEGLLKAN
jgi:pyruvate formate lyase activating enzyme